MTSEESPVCLSPAVGWDIADQQLPGTRIVSIDGIDVRDPTRLALPGIRVGDGKGSGYVLPRAMDDQFVFVPDAGYVGETKVVFGVEESGGRVVERIASILVRPELGSNSVIAFANGSEGARIVEGTEVAIVGALTIDGAKPNPHDEIRIIEGDPASSRERFSVVSDKLLLNETLECAAEDVVRLKVVVVEDDFEVARNELEITVEPAGQTVAMPSSELAEGRSRLRIVSDNQAPADQFKFRAVPDSSQDLLNEVVAAQIEEDEGTAPRVDEATSAAGLEPVVKDVSFDPFAE